MERTTWDGVYWLADEQVLLGGTSFNVRFQIEGRPEQAPAKESVDVLIQSVVAAIQPQWSDIVRDLAGESTWEWLAAIERISVSVGEERWDAYLERNSDDGDEVEEHFASGKRAS